MEIKTLETLLKNKYPNGAAWVSSPTDERGNKKSTRRVSVQFTAGGKVYDYADTIRAVAERLELLPSPPNKMDAARRVASAINNGATTVFDYADGGYIREGHVYVNIPAGLVVRMSCEPVSYDDFGYGIFEYSVAKIW